jgi:hypothetical protein
VFLCSAGSERVFIEGLDHRGMEVVKGNITAVLHIFQRLYVQGGILAFEVSDICRPEVVAEDILVGGRVLAVPRELDIVAARITEQSKSLCHSDACEASSTGTFTDMLAGTVLTFAGVFTATFVSGTATVFLFSSRTAMTMMVVMMLLLWRPRPRTLARASGSTARFHLECNNNPRWKMQDTLYR